MVLIVYHMQCPIFEFECLSFPWAPLSSEKMGIHCVIVPFFSYSTQKKCVNSSQYGLCLHLPTFLYSVCRKRGTLMRKMVCVKRAHELEIGFRLTFLQSRTQCFNLKTAGLPQCLLVFTEVLVASIHLFF